MSPEEMEVGQRKRARRIIPETQEEEPSPEELQEEEVYSERTETRSAKEITEIFFESALHLIASNHSTQILKALFRNSDAIRHIRPGYPNPTETIYMLESIGVPEMRLDPSFEDLEQQVERLQPFCGNTLLLYLISVHKTHEDFVSVFVKDQVLLGLVLSFLYHRQVPPTGLIPDGTVVREGWPFTQHPTLEHFELCSDLNRLATVSHMLRLITRTPPAIIQQFWDDTRLDDRVNVISDFWNDLDVLGDTFFEAAQIKLDSPEGTVYVVRRDWEKEQEHVFNQTENAHERNRVFGVFKRLFVSIQFVLRGREKLDAFRDISPHIVQMFRDVKLIYEYRL